jgi:hypothetical protein
MYTDDALDARSKLRNDPSIDSPLVSLNPPLVSLNPPLVPLNPQVDLDMYTDDALDARSKLRNDPSIEDALAKWWRVLPKEFGGVGKHSHQLLSMGLSKALLPSYSQVGF